MSQQGFIKGRGTAIQPNARFESTHTEVQDDGWIGDPDDTPPIARTHVTEERARSIISHNASPDVPIDASLNPYRGCEHGCSYCFARPTHAYINPSPGLDFETKLFAKTNAAAVLEAVLAKPSYRCVTITLGTNTDPYQPIERRYAITRQVLEVLARTRHPVAIITKNALIERDLDLLVDLARDGLVRVMVSITTLDNRLSSKLEPRASAPHRRIETVRVLSAAGVPVSVLVAPLIPMITDRFLEEILELSHAAGAQGAGYVLIRLPHEVKDIFRDWLRMHFPDRAEHVMILIQQMRGGRDYDARFGTRMKGEGVFADLLKARFTRMQRQLGLSLRSENPLDTSLFRAPRKPQSQGDLFGS